MRNSMLFFRPQLRTPKSVWHVSFNVSMPDLHFLHCASCLGIVLNFVQLIFKWAFRKVWSVQEVWGNSSVVSFSLILSHTALSFKHISLLKKLNEILRVFYDTFFKFIWIASISFLQPRKKSIDFFLKPPQFTPLIDIWKERWYIATTVNVIVTVCLFQKKNIYFPVTIISNMYEQICCDSHVHLFHHGVKGENKTCKSLAP